MMPLNSIAVAYDKCVQFLLYVRGFLALFEADSPA